MGGHISVATCSSFHLSEVLSVQWTGNRSNFTGPITSLPGFVLGLTLRLDLWYTYYLCDVYKPVVLIVQFYTNCYLSKQFKCKKNWLASFSF